MKSFVILLITCTSCCLALPETREVVELGGRQYYFSHVELKALFKVAAKTCNDINMSLLSLETLEEAALIREYLVTNALTVSFWTSGFYFDGEWLWSGSGQYFTDVQWYPGQPDNFGQSYEQCVFLLNNATLWDTSCDTPYSFICEKNSC